MLIKYANYFIVVINIQNYEQNLMSIHFCLKRPQSRVHNNWPLLKDFLTESSDGI